MRADRALARRRESRWRARAGRARQRGCPVADLHQQAALHRAHHRHAAQRPRHLGVGHAVVQVARGRRNVTAASSSAPACQRSRSRLSHGAGHRHRGAAGDRPPRRRRPGLPRTRARNVTTSSRRTASSTSTQARRQSASAPRGSSAAAEREAAELLDRSTARSDGRSAAASACCVSTAPAKRAGGAARRQAQPREPASRGQHAGDRTRPMPPAAATPAYRSQRRAPGRSHAPRASARLRATRRQSARDEAMQDAQTGSCRTPRPGARDRRRRRLRNIRDRLRGWRPRRNRRLALFGHVAAARPHRQPAALHAHADAAPGAVGGAARD